MNPFFNTLLNALSYQGDVLLSVINYSLLMVAILPFVVTSLRTKVSFWWIVLLSSFLLQAVLWFALYVQGISIIWNALFGFLMIVFFRQKTGLSNKHKILIYFAMGMLVLGNVYFGFRFPPITTIAHVSAIVFGMLFSLGRKL